jgi:PAS domain S-box-containing protein
LTDTGRWQGELVHISKNGTPVVVASRWSLQQDNEGTPTAILEINNDISEQKRAEEARREMKEQWRAAFESNPTMFFVLASDGTIANVNAFGAEQLGYTATELVGQSVLNIFYEPDRLAVQKRAKECFDQPGRMMRWEARKIRKDGTVIWVRETANAVVLKERPVLLVVCEDITEQKRAEEAARRSEKELRDLIDTMPTMAWIALPDGSNAFVTRQWFQYTGLSAEQSSGAGWESTIHPEDFVRHIEEWQRSLASGQPFEHETRLRRAADGQYRWFLIRGVPLRGEQGNISKWYGIATDIEDRKRAEEALQRNEAYLAEAQKLSRTGSWAFSPVSGKTHYWSDEMFRIWGFDPQQGPPDPQTVLQRIHPHDRERMREIFERGFGGRLTVEVIADHRIMLPDGTVKNIHGISYPVFDEAGRVVEYVGTAIDVTERKQSEEALRRSEAYLTESQRLTHTGSWAWDPRRERLIYCSEELFRIFGFDPPGAVPPIEMFGDRVHPKDRERWRWEINDESAKKKEHTFEYRLLLPDRAMKYVVSIRHPVFDRTGELVEVIGTTIDITERKRAEEELRKTETRFRTYVDNATDALLVHDEEGTILD